MNDRAPWSEQSSRRGSLDDSSNLPSTVDSVVTHEWTKFSDVPVHGDSLAGKPSDTIHVYFENIDGFRVDPKQSLRNNKNLTYYNNLITRLDIDIVGGAEARTN